MDIRNGKCFDCGAEYQIPASFGHDVARCKECGKTVHIAKLGDPVPTRPPAPKAPARPKIEEHVPSGKKGQGPSMMERLRAERAAAAGAGAGAAAGSSAGSSAGKSASKPAKAGSKRISAKPSLKTPAKASATRKTGAKSGASRRSAGGSSSRRRNSRSSGEVRERGARGEKKSPVMGLAAVALLVVGGGVFLMKDKLFGDGGKANAMDSTTEEVATDNAADVQNVDGESINLEDAAGETEGVLNELAEGADSAAEGEGDDSVAADSSDEEPAVEKPVDTGPDTTALADIGPLFGATQDETAEMEDLMATWMDPAAGAAGNRARDRLMNEFGVKALPAIMNSFKLQDPATEAGFSNGDNIQRALKDMFYGTNLDWWFPKQHPDTYVAFDRKVIAGWHHHLSRVSNEGIEYFILMAKLEAKDKDGSGEFAKPERAKIAAELREQFGGGASTESSDGVDTGMGMDDLDLDVD